MTGTQLVALVGYALAVAAAATWLGRDQVRRTYPLVTAGSVFLAGLLAAGLAGLVSSSSRFPTVAGGTGLATFVFVGALTYRAAPARAGPEPERVRAARTVAVALALLPAVVLVV